jgi:hypothetical protein
LSKLPLSLGFAAFFIYNRFMDTNELIAHGRARFEHAAARRLLREKYQAKMLFACAGGMWQAGPELLTVLTVLDQPEAVILDVYQTPVRITVSELRDLARQRWQEQMTAWLIEHDTLAKNR